MLAERTREHARRLLEVRDLKKHFPIHAGLLRRRVGEVKAVDGVSFEIYRGETLGLVGESGCGKTTTGRALLRAVEPTAGQVLLHDGDLAIDLLALGKQELRRVRHRLQMIFQDPYASLNPRMTIEQIVSEPLKCYGVPGKERSARVAELLTVVGLDPKYMSRYPHAFSGGQRQRVGIARALALHPSLIVADEAVSALDVSIQAQILNLLQDLQERYGLSYLFIAHDLGVVEHICDRVAVMYVGQIVEMAGTDDLFTRPRHPYVEALLSAVPRPDPHYRLERAAPKGEVADPSHRPSGCAFHPRCHYATECCRTEQPALVDVAAPGQQPHWVACHHAEHLQLTGVLGSEQSTIPVARTDEAVPVEPS